MSDETPAGCLHRDHPAAARCNKLCDAGETFCPYHLLLQAVELDAAKRKPAQAAQTYKTPRAYRE